jgi:hypothetical protein
MQPKDQAWTLRVDRNRGDNAVVYTETPNGAACVWRHRKFGNGIPF